MKITRISHLEIKCGKGFISAKNLDDLCRKAKIDRKLMNRLIKASDAQKKYFGEGN